MKERILILLLLATVCSMQAQNIHMALRPDDLLIDNFEGDTFGNWILEGNAFGNSPVSKSISFKIHQFLWNVCQYGGIIGLKEIGWLLALSMEMPVPVY